MSYRKLLLYYLLIGGIFLCLSVQTQANSIFTDISPGSWAWPYVERLESLGLLEPFTGPEFRGEQSVTRYELAQSLYYMLDYMENNSGRVTARVELQSYALQFSEQIADLEHRLSLLEAKSQLQQIEIDQLRTQIAQNEQTRLSEIIISDPSLRELPRYDQRISELESSLSRLEQDVQAKNDQINKLYIVIALLGATSILK